MNARDFIAKWKHVELKERSAAQEHFIDPCRLLGHPTPAEADPTGASFCFEKGGEKLGGGNGFADVTSYPSVSVFSLNHRSSRRPMIWQPRALAWTASPMNQP
jgi:hypothetical protein